MKLKRQGGFLPFLAASFSPVAAIVTEFSSSFAPGEGLQERRHGID